MTARKHPLADLNDLLRWEPIAINYDLRAAGAPTRPDDDEQWEATERELEQHRERLAAELQQIVRRGVSVEPEEPESPGAFAWGPTGVDTIWLVLSALGGYQAVRFAADDVRKVIRRFRSRGTKPVSVNRAAATLLAWDAVLETGNFAHVTLEYYADISLPMRPGVFEDHAGWLFSFVADGNQRNFVVRTDGTVLGSSSGPDEELVRRLKRGRRKFD